MNHSSHRGHFQTKQRSVGQGSNFKSFPKKSVKFIILWIPIDKNWISPSKICRTVLVVVPLDMNGSELLEGFTQMP